VKPDRFPKPLRLQVLQSLERAATERKIVPAGDLAPLAALMQQAAKDQSPDLLLATIRLAGVWKVPAAATTLRDLALDRMAPGNLRRAALEGLVAFGGDDNRRALEQIAVGDAPMSLRLTAASGLATYDVGAAAKVAAPLITKLQAGDDPLYLLKAFVDRKEGGEALAAALEQSPPPTDAAKLALRQMFAAGITHPQLSASLSKAAGLEAETPLPTPDEVKQLVANAMKHGDAARGEMLFRRGDVGCFRCHALHRAGGQVGPELTPLGATSPPEYVVESILNPSLAIKEQYITKTIFTDDGRQVTGIVVDRNNDRVIVRDATGALTTVRTEQIEEEIEGKSLMPEGITKFLTESEVLDLIRFVAELGKGDYAVRTEPIIQRWRVLRDPQPALTQDVPTLESIRELVLAAPPEAWTGAYGLMSGVLPLAELRTADGPNVLIVQGQIEVTERGAVDVLIESSEPHQVWIGADEHGAETKIRAVVTPGIVPITLRIPLGEKSQPTLRVRVQKPEGASTQFDVVGGA
jgi:putative heme-binding domain-containing protein